MKPLTKKQQGRTRMMFDLGPAFQMAIRLRALKSNITTGEVLIRAVEQAFPKELEEARKIIATQKAGGQ